MTKASNALSGPIKLTDLADLLGLDKSTVSRALNRRPADVARIAGELGVNIPGDLSLTGFDDVDLHLVERLGLTTARVDLASQATRAIEVLLAYDSSRTERAEIHVPTELVIRSSTAPPNGPSTGKANQR